MTVTLTLTASEFALLQVCLAIAQREFVARTTETWTPMWKDVVRRDAQAVANLVKKIGGGG